MESGELLSLFKSADEYKQLELNFMFLVWIDQSCRPDFFVVFVYGFALGVNLPFT